MKRLCAIFALTAGLLSGAFAADQTFYGKASWYGSKFHGRTTASGEIYDMNKLTAAHKELPFGTLLRVTNLDNGKSIVVKVIDRGPFVQGRVLDLSRKAAEELDFIRQGVANIKVEVLDEKNKDQEIPAETGEIKKDAVSQEPQKDPSVENSQKDIQAKPSEEKESDISDQDTIDSIISALKSDTGKGSDEENPEGTTEAKKKEPVKEETPTAVQKQSDKVAFDESKMKEEEIPLDTKKKDAFEQKTYQIFVIQLGAFSSQEKANLFMKTLQEKGLETYITTVERDKQVLYKVRDKRIFKDLTQVLEQAKQIRSMGLECFIIGKFFVGS